MKHNNMLLNHFRETHQRTLTIYFTLKRAVEAVSQNCDRDSDHDCVPEICILPTNDGVGSEFEAIDRIWRWDRRYVKG